VHTFPVPAAVTPWFPRRGGPLLWTRATSAGRILAVPVAQLRVVMAHEPGLSDLILRTFLLRHSILMRRGAGLTLIGSRFDLTPAGNSAGQAALFLSRSSAEVHVIIRGESLHASMSRYLTDRIGQDPRITVWTRTEVTELTGTGRLQGVRISRASRPGESELAIHGLFVFIGAQPRTGWLAGQLAEDSRGFLLTGTGIPAAALGDQAATPLFLETSRPGIFAVGDVRSGSVKRAAAAIGEGSMAVRLVFDRLKSTGSTNAIELGPPA
jgi:alkyl hydroperoxide reductase subunit AhpF